MKKLLRREPKFNGLCVGLDLHKRFIHASVLDASGDEVLSMRLASDPDALMRLLDDLSSQGHALRVVIEASGCFLWVHDLVLDRLGPESVQVAAPGKVRVIAQSGQKTDATDAWWLAYLGHEGRLPLAYVAQGSLRELRIASRELREVIDRRSDLMRRMKSHLAQLGLGFGASAWSSVAGRSRVQALVDEVMARHGMRGQAICRLWLGIQQLSQEVAFWREQVQKLSQGFQEVGLLGDQLPGVGPQIAAVVWSELGDPRRYRTAKAYAKATGLTPSYRESGGRRQGGGITREGSRHVRWALTRAVLACSRCRQGPGVWLWRWVDHKSRRKARKSAMVAAARKLAESIWRLFAWGDALDLGRVFGGLPRAAGAGPCPPPGSPRKPRKPGDALMFPPEEMLHGGRAIPG